jgi:hypothetical protein
VQHKLPEGSEQAMQNNRPITLAPKEAMEAIKTLLAEMTLNRAMVFPVLPELRIRVKQLRLLYLPFIRSSHDYINPETGIAMQTAAVRFGKAL